MKNHDSKPQSELTLFTDKLYSDEFNRLKNDWLKWDIDKQYLIK